MPAKFKVAALRPEPVAMVTEPRDSPELVLLYEVIQNSVLVNIGFILVATYTAYIIYWYKTFIPSTYK